MKELKNEVLASACAGSVRTMKTLVACVATDEDLIGIHYAVFLTREELERVRHYLGEFLSFEIGKKDLG